MQQINIVILILYCVCAVEDIMGDRRALMDFEHETEEEGYEEFVAARNFILEL